MGQSVSETHKSMRDGFVASSIVAVGYAAIFLVLFVRGETPSVSSMLAQAGPQVVFIGALTVAASVALRKWNRRWAR